MKGNAAAWLDPLDRALVRLEEALNAPKNAFVRDSAIQRFEFTYEPAWKALKAFFEDRGIQVQPFPRDLFREAFQRGVIADDPLWMDSIAMRNLTSHTYNEKTAEDIYARLPALAKLYRSLRERLKKA